MNIKQVAKKNFQYFFYFYRYLRYRLFISFGLSFFKGVLDGFGLAMFIPLLKMSNASEDAANSDNLGHLSFLPKFLEKIGIDLNITSILVVILVFFSLKGVVYFFEGYVRVIYQQLFIREIRISNINLLNSFKYGNFVKSDVGKIQNTFSGEVERVNVAYRSYFKSIEYGVLIFVYIALAFSANAGFSILVAVGGVLSNFLFKWLFKKTKKLSVKFTESSHSFQGLLIQHVSTYKYLKATGLNWFYGKKLKKNINEIEVLQRELGIVGSTLTALREPVTMFVVVIAILIQVTYFNSDIGLIILSLLFLYRALSFLMALQEHWNRFLGVSGSMQNMTDFSEELAANKEINGKVEFKYFQNSIVLKNVDFDYDGTQVLKNINLEIKKNETIAFVGESGSGKTTLVNLVAGLLTSENGSIEIDGVDLESLDKTSYRKNFGYVSQDAPIFNDTVFNNVTFWAKKTKKNEKKFMDAVKKASIRKFIENMSEKENTFLGNNGINISGGQKQRLAIARELYKDVQFLFLDEATSALDGETETAIQSNIDKLKGQYTIIMIAHRLSTIKNADRIVVLNEGRINAIGNFKELVNTSPKFREMVRLQRMSHE